MFFVVSTGRSGTKTLAEALNALNGYVCSHEPAPELILESSAYRYGTVSRDELVQILLGSRYPKVGDSVYCESNQTLSLIIPALVEAFPQARFIWLIRNALDFVASAYQKQWYTGHSENHDRYEDCPPLERAWIDGRVVGDRCGDMKTHEWHNLDRFSRICWYWSYVNRLIEEDLGRYAPDSFMLIRLEEIEVKLSELVRWMGLGVLTLPKVGCCNVAKRQPYHWSKWDGQQRVMFEKWCGDLMDRFYPKWRIAKEHGKVSTMKLEWKYLDH
jgi:hypothetical protein